MSGLNQRAKYEIALLAGDDLEDERREQARQSVESCSACRQHWVRLRGSLDILGRAGRAIEPTSEASLWPSIEAQLRPATAKPTPQEFNGWIPALSMAAACIVLLVVGRLDEHSAPRGGTQAIQEPVMATGPGQFQWTSGDSERVHDEGVMLTEPFSYDSAEARLWFGNSLERRTAPILWTNPRTNR